MERGASKCILSTDLPWSWINTPKCPKCKKSFSKQNEYATRLVLLPCSHYVCVNCISSLSLKNDSICDQCSSKITFNRSMYPEIEFETDFYANGLTLYKTCTLPDILRTTIIGPKDSTRTVMSALPESKCNECSISTQHECVECNVPYCNKCFDEVHAAGKVLRQHQIVPIAPIKAILPRTFGRVLCKHHNKELDHYCQTCKVAICHLCISKGHNRHETTKVISNGKVNLDETMNILKSTQKKIDEANQIAVSSINEISDNATSTAEEISKEFQHYHSIFQNIEKDTLIELKKRTVDYMQKIRQAYDCLLLNSEQIEMIKSQVIKFSENIPQDINLATLHDEVMDLLEDMPTNLKIEHFDENLFSFEVPDFDQSAVRSTFQVMFKANHFSTKSTAFCAEPYSVLDANDTLLCDRALMNKVQKIKEQATSNDASNTSSLQSHRSLKTLKSLRIKTREVCVVEIKDPKTFFIQNIEVLETAEQFIQECIHCAADSVTDVAIDDMVLLYEFDGTKWYRGIVKEKLAKSEVAVYLVDHGRTLKVKAGQLRRISTQLESIPAAVSVFTIFNVEPNGKWNDESMALVQEIASKERMTMIYEEDNEHSGDLITHSAYPTSIKDILLYLQYAVMANVTDRNVGELHRVMEEKKKLLINNMKKEQDFKKQSINLVESFPAKMVNIISPKEFYITKMCLAEKIEVLSENINRFYSEGQHRKIYYPHIGMACCVYTSGRWSRARIHKHRPDLVVQVFLVDIGAYSNIEWGHILMLDHQFMNLPEGVLKCGLVDIEPKNFETKWDPQATVELKRLCENELKVYVYAVNSHSIEILLYVVKKTMSYLVNAWLAELGFAEWIGENELKVEYPHDDLLNSSTSSFAIIPQNTHQNRQSVKIADIISPSEFYVTLNSEVCMKAFEIMHSKLQESMSTYTHCQKNKKWEVGDHCLAKVLISNRIWEWSRGEIRSIEKDTATVFLRDYGKIVTLTWPNLAKIELNYDTVTDAAIKCHLANMKLASKYDWSKSAIDEFKCLTTSDDGYDALAVSVCGKMVNDSLPVYLWRQKKLHYCPLSAPSILWQNINEKFADYIEKLKTIVDCDSFDDQMQHNEMVDVTGWSAELIDGYVDVNTDKVKKEKSFDEDFLLESALGQETDDYRKTKVTAWLPANPIGKYQFTAIPTHVGNNAVIYLHATSQMECLEELKSIINDQTANMPCDMSYEWKVGDKCMVRFHLDDCFYRGLIKDVMPEKQFKIEFVDYGNIEKCNQSDIREANILENVPIQATKYYLPLLKPKSENGLWDRTILEFIHGRIVNKMVNVRVRVEGKDRINEEYIPCSITATELNMHEVLLANNLADRTIDSNIRLQHPDIDYCEDSHETFDADQNEQSSSFDKLEEKITEKCENKKQEEYIAPSNFDHLSADDIVGDDSYEIFNENPGLNNDESVQFFDFDPMDNSTEISDVSPKTLNFHPFMEFKPSKDIKKMSAKIAHFIDSAHVVLEPIIEEFIYNWQKMEEKFKRTPHDSTEKFNFRDNRACLARYDVDNCYYRAIIEDPSYSDDSVRVMFVDYLQSKTVERKFIRQCPVEVLEQPLKYFIVKLHGVTPYPRFRGKDITTRLEEYKYKNVILKIVEEHTSPKSVQLYDSENENMLIYQSLIDQSVYKQC